MIFFHSYSINNFEIFDFIEQYPNMSHNDIIQNAFDMIIDDYPTDNDKEFLLGIVVYFLYQGLEIDKNYLNISLKIAEYLLQYSNFKYWNNKNKRKLFINNEKIRIKKAIKYNKIMPIDIKKIDDKKLNT
jgi:hypothetical protein